MSERKTRFQKAMAGSFDDIDVFTNINEIRKLGNEIELLDVINPTSCTYGKIAELLSRVKALKEFELLSDGENISINHPN
jgi:sulfatase maturation enzyme AslB (radical SAM superfamily)